MADVILSSKEDRILKAYLRGMECRDIAKLIGLTYGSTHAYILSIVKAFGLTSRSELHSGLKYTVREPNRSRI